MNKRYRVEAAIRGRAASAITHRKVPERTARRHAAVTRMSARVLDMSLYPRWLYLGNLAIPNGGTARPAHELIGMSEPVLTDEDMTTMHFGRDELPKHMPFRR